MFCKNRLDFLITMNIFTVILPASPLLHLLFASTSTKTASVSTNVVVAFIALYAKGESTKLVSRRGAH